MVNVKSYQIPPTRLIPNSPFPLLHYPSFLSNGTTVSPAQAYDLFSSNGWHVQWIFRYASTQPSHYHSAAHECMAVLSGSATIRFGVADLGSGHEDGGLEIEAHAGDVFVLPAGVAHKTFDAGPDGFVKLLTPGDGHGVAAEDTRKALDGITLEGFTMLGAYPEGSAWDFREGGEDEGAYDKVWAVEKPKLDPVVGIDAQGLFGLWK